MVGVDDDAGLVEHDDRIRNRLEEHVERNGPRIQHAVAHHRIADDGGTETEAGQRRVHRQPRRRRSRLRRHLGENVGAHRQQRARRQHGALRATRPAPIPQQQAGGEQCVGVVEGQVKWIQRSVQPDELAAARRDLGEEPAVPVVGERERTKHQRPQIHEPPPPRPRRSADVMEREQQPAGGDEPDGWELRCKPYPRVRCVELLTEVTENPPGGGGFEHDEVAETAVPPVRPGHDRQRARTQRP